MAKACEHVYSARFLEHRVVRLLHKGTCEAARHGRGGLSIGAVAAQEQVVSFFLSRKTLRSARDGLPTLPASCLSMPRSTWEGVPQSLLSLRSHVRDETPYPAVLLTTGSQDPRLAPWEPAKITARLQAATTSRKPVLLRVDYEGGHGIGSTRIQVEQQVADERSFLFWQFGLAEFQPSARKLQ